MRAFLGLAGRNARVARETDFDRAEQGQTRVRMLHFHHAAVKIERVLGRADAKQCSAVLVI